ncbi:MAG: TlpA disulfide reductase family protein [Thiolinea sp.]
MKIAAPIARQNGKIGVWNLLGLLALFVLGIVFALYTQKETVQPVDLQTLAGERVSLPGSGLTWVNFWSVSCPPCMEEMPYLDKLHHEYRGRADIIAVSAFYDPPNIIKEVQEKLKLTLPLALDLDGQAASRFPGNDVVPSHYLLDADGTVLLTLRGTLSEATIREALNNYL